MTTRTTLPTDYDPRFIATKADTADNFGYDSVGGHTILVYPLDKFDAVQAAIASYPVDHLEVERPVAIADIADLRRQKIESFKFNGVPISLDPETRANLSGAALGLMRNQDVLEIDWQIQPGVFVSLPANVVLAMADAAFRYVQACFTHARALTEQTMAAPDIFALRAIDIEAGWPE